MERKHKLATIPEEPESTANSSSSPAQLEQQSSPKSSQVQLDQQPDPKSMSASNQTREPLQVSQALVAQDVDKNSQQHEESSRISQESDQQESRETSPAQWEQQSSPRSRQVQLEQQPDPKSKSASNQTREPLKVSQALDPEAVAFVPEKAKLFLSVLSLNTGKRRDLAGLGRMVRENRPDPGER